MSRPWTALGVIPARGGSRAVPRKNVHLLGGRPLIEYTISAALAADRLDHVVVSTEDVEIGDLARALGVAVIARPAELATDTAPMVPVVQQALASVEEHRGQRFDCVVTLQVTAPFRLPSDIDTAVSMLEATGADSVLGVVRLFDAHPARAKRMVAGRLQDFCVPEDEHSRRQDLEPAYLRNGAIYVTRRDVVDAGSLRGSDQVGYEMPADRSVNIDEPLDFLLAEAVLTSGELP